MDESLIIKYLRNQCTPKEAEEALRWLNEHGDEAAGQALMRKIWTDFQSDPQSESLDQERLLDRIHHEVNLRSLSPVVPPAPIRARFGQWLLRAAAALFLPLLSLFLLTYLTGNDPFVAFRQTEPEWAEISTLAGGKAKFQLPDGTNVWLSFESRLRYPLVFAGAVREVELEGEAFFDVAHSAETPFRVKAGGLGILATGTEFNVFAYPEDETIETTLISGAVSIEQVTSRGYRKVDEMAPGDYDVFVKEERRLLQYPNIDTEQHTSWREGKLIFEKAPLESVLKRLARWYNVQFEAMDPRLEEMEVRLIVTDDTLAQVLEALAIAIPIRTELVRGAIMSDGTYAKSRVRVYLR